MDENDAAQIAAAVHPAHQQCAGTRIFGAQLAASVSAAQVAQKIQWYGLHIQLLAWRRGAISARATCSCSPEPWRASIFRRAPLRQNIRTAGFPAPEAPPGAWPARPKRR